MCGQSHTPTLFPYTTLFRSVTSTPSTQSRINGTGRRNNSDKRWATGAKLLASENSPSTGRRSEEHTSELQSRGHLVCRLLLDKTNKEQTKHSERTSDNANGQ